MPAGSNSFDPAALEEQLARVDPDRAMAARFAPPAARARLIGLYAFNFEIARVRERVTEPAIGDMRLAWWREAVDEIYDPHRKVRWHEAAMALQEAFGDRPPPRLWIDRLINTRGRDLDADPFGSLDELRDYAEASAATLMRAAVWMLAPDLDLSSDAERAITHAGTAWGLAGILRAAPGLAAQGQSVLPLDLAELTGVDAAALHPGGDAREAKAILAPVIELARREHRFARETYRAIPAECAPACLYAALTPAYLARLARRSDPFRQTGELSAFGRRARMVVSAGLGRI